MFVLYYLLIGSVVNIYTMFNKEVWEYWCEFGLIGFCIQFIMGVVFFPMVLFALIKEKFTKK